MYKKYLFFYLFFLIIFNQIDVFAKDYSETTAYNYEMNFSNISEEILSSSNILNYSSLALLREDGLIDWTPAIEYALNQNQSIYFPDGIYYISHDIILNQNNQSLFGNGKQSCIKALPNSSFDYAMVVIQASYVQIRDLCITGFSETIRCNSPIILSTENVNTNTKTNYIKLLNVFVYYSNSYGILLTNGYDAVLDNCTSNFCYDGFYILCTDTQIIACYASFNKNHGFRLFGGCNQLLNCKSYLNSNCGYSGSTNDYTFVNCDSQENGNNGFQIFETNNVSLIGCHSESNNTCNSSSSGIYIASCNNIQILGCRIINSLHMKGQQYNGIRVDSSSNIDINCQVSTVNSQYKTCNSDNFHEKYSIAEQCNNINFLN